MELESFTSFFMNNPNMWFNPQKKYDDFVRKQYKRLLKTTDIFTNLTLSNSNEELFEFIIIFDQLPYYIFRDDKKSIKKYQNLALQLAEVLIDHERFNQYSETEKCFIMLPLRHSNSIENNYKILKIINNLRKENNTSSIYKRFFKATLLKLGELINDKSLNQYYYDYPIFPLLFDNCVLDENCNFTRLIDCSVTDNITIKNISTKLSSYNKICVSISGGVDSILLLFVCKFLKKDVIAIHINYKNRETSDMEMNNVIFICNFLRIPIYVREFKELQRDSCDRNIYEEVTRKIRFDFYKKITDGEYIVALGHNNDDCIENIFTNIMKEKNYDNLNGMKLLGNENDVNIIRPMLDIPKSKIYELANEYKLPYLYDSTPDWSDRGKLRDSLIPSITNFDNRIIPGLQKLVQQIDSINMIYEDHIKNMVTEWGISDNFLCRLDERAFTYDYNFFNRIMSYVCKEKKIPYFTQKCISYLFNNQTSDRVIKLNNEYNYKNYFIYKE